jgi:hypothetical protein
VVEEQGRLGVRAGVEQRTGCDHAGRRPEEHLGERDDVDPQVQQGPATECQVEQPVHRVVLPGHAEVGLHRAHLADRAVGDQFLQGDDRRLEAGPHRLHDEDPGLAGEVDDLLRAGGGRGERLLHQQRLARPQRRERECVVLGVRSGEVQDVDVRVGQDLGVGPVGPVLSVPPREGLRSLQRPGRDGHGARTVDDGEVLDHLLRDAARPDDSPADLPIHDPDASGEPNRSRLPSGSMCHPSRSP